ncbi:MAG: hypothetical protein U0Q07_16885 [Acidimicrobiales bacterium]
MADVLFVAIVVGFFGLMVLLVRACDAIIGPDPLELDVVDDADAPPAEAAEDRAEVVA